MALVAADFTFRPGVPGDLFRNVRLVGGWDAQGRPSGGQSVTSMEGRPGRDGCPEFHARVQLDDAHVGESFRWGVRLDGPGYEGMWGVAGEGGLADADGLWKRFVFRGEGQAESHQLTHCRRLGANKHRTPGRDRPGIRFAVWAPNAAGIDLVLGDPAVGYVADDASGTVRSLPMARDGEAGVWAVGPDTQPDLAEYDRFVGRPYMFRVTMGAGGIAYRTDLHSRGQVGRGSFDPKGARYGGLPRRLDGTKSCSVVHDPDRVTDEEGALAPAAEFWRDEFTPEHPLPTRIEDLVIYELHVGALGFGRRDAGTINDALAFVDHLAELGVNAVELLPVAEFQGEVGWGYSTSHFGAVEGSVGGPDRLKHFVRACHRRGIAVILDVVYNHYNGDAERAEWEYDSRDPARNVYYWYEGQPSDYAQADGGYIDNESTGFAPRFHEEMVRQLFVSSAAAFLTDFHIDGFRVDQTTSIHAYPKRHADGRHAGTAAAFGSRFLRQWTRTLRLIKPGVFLMAEDHSGWPAVTEPAAVEPADRGDGLGFDAAWYSDFYHHLVDFGGGGAEWAKLLRTAGYGDDRPLAMSHFAGALRASGGRKVTYNDSHDEAGNSEGSARTIVQAVNFAPLVGETRRWAEARARFAAGMALLSAGTPMFFMGEEVGAQQPYRYNDFLAHREDILGLKAGSGRDLFRFYRDLVALSRGSAAIRSRDIDVLLASDAERLIAFHRRGGGEQILVVGSLARAPYASRVVRGERLGDAGWTEVFNSDAERYGGWNSGNGGATLQARGGALAVMIPASGFVVFRRSP